MARVDGISRVEIDTSLTSLVISSRSFTQSNSLQSIDRHVSTGSEAILHHRGNFPLQREKSASGQILIHRSTLQLHEAFSHTTKTASQGIQHVCSARKIFTIEKKGEKLSSADSFIIFSIRVKKRVNFAPFSTFFPFVHWKFDSASSNVGMNVQYSLRYSISQKKTKPGSINSMKNSSNTNCDKSKSSKQAAAQVTHRRRREISRKVNYYRLFALLPVLFTFSFSRLLIGFSSRSKARKFSTFQWMWPLMQKLQRTTRTSHRAYTKAHETFVLFAQSSLTHFYCVYDRGRASL